VPERQHRVGFEVANGNGSAQIRLSALSHVGMFLRNPAWRRLRGVEGQQRPAT
jgi:hypothetical protein